MRYVLIVMLWFSASAQAEEWTFLFTQHEKDYYFGDVEFNPLNQTILMKSLMDKGGPIGIESLVRHFQIRCVDKKPTRERTFYMAGYEGRMATGNVGYQSYGAPWIPFKQTRLEGLLTAWCEELWEQRSR